MKAVIKTANGGPEVLRYEDCPDPTPGENEVLVEVAAAGVNFMDIGKRRGMETGGYDPAILGVEGAGRIVELGQGVVDFAVGDRVAWVFVPNSYAERIVAPVAALVKLPDEIDERTAASVMMQGLTASHFTTDFYPIGPGDVALVHAAAGGLGLLMTQIIKMRGGVVIGRVSSPDKVAVAQAAGADHVIVDAVGDFAQEALRLTGGRGVDVVYDGSGPSTFQGSMDALRRSGVFCWYGPVLGAPSGLEIMSLPKSIKLGYAVFADHIPTLELFQARAQRLFGWISSGAIKVNSGGTYDLADAAKAHEAMESRKSTGKLLLIP